MRSKYLKIFSHKKEDEMQIYFWTVLYTGDRVKDRDCKPLSL